MANYIRPDSRAHDQMRTVRFEPGIAPKATGSVLACYGDTRVICSVMCEKKVPPWMRAQNVEGGWITAEYSMLPYSTSPRKQRDSSRGKTDGRTVEIQRLIGRALRAIVDLKKLPPLTLWVDCDVLEADGGTRTAAISGAYVALKLAIDCLLRDQVIEHNPLRDSLAAVSVGIVGDTPLLDLCYIEDYAAEVDANVVMTGSGRLVEIQSSGEETTFTRPQLDQLLGLAEKGIAEILVLQKSCTTD